MKAAFLLCAFVYICVVDSFPGDKRFSEHFFSRSADVKGDRLKRQSQNDQKRIMCYYASWSFNREGPNRFTPENIDTKLCTHVIYGYARPELKQGILPYDIKPDVEERLWERTVALKKINPQLKVILAVGGIIEGSSRFSKLAADPREREIFVKSAGNIVRTNGFDGLDMSWIYPGFSEGSSTSDKENYSILLKELRKEFGNDLILSVTIPGLDRLIDAGYDLPEVLKYVNFINVWAGAYHSATSPTVNHPSPLYNFLNDDTTKDDNVNATISSLLRRGVPPSVMNLLIANYGSFYLLEDPELTDIGSPADDEADFTEWRGGLNYNEFCLRVLRDEWTVKRVNDSAVGPYAFKGKEWVAWDDEIIVRHKAKYALDKKLGGVGFWTIDMDDFRGACHYTPYPLLRAAYQVFIEQSNKNNVSSEGADGATNRNFSPQPTTTESSFVITTPSQPVPPFFQTPADRSPQSSTSEPFPPFEGNSVNPSFDNFPIVKGTSVFQSNRDIVFQSIKVWIINHFYNSPTTPSNVQKS